MDKDENIDGVSIVLAASRAEANEYNNNPFSAFICTFPKKLSGYALREHLENIPTNKDGNSKAIVATM